MNKHPLEYESMDEREIDRLKALNAELVAALRELRNDIADLLKPLDQYPDEPLSEVPSIKRANAALKAAENAVDK